MGGQEVDVHFFFWKGGTPKQAGVWRGERLQPLRCAQTMRDLGQGLGENPLCNIPTERGVVSKGIGEPAGWHAPSPENTANYLYAHGCPSGCTGRCGAGLPGWTLPAAWGRVAMPGVVL